MIFTKNMFNEIKGSLAGKDSSYKEVMKFEPGKTYVVRLLPNITDPKETIYHYYHHSWNSLSTGQFVTALCPTTYGESCPIDQYVFKTYNNGTSEEKVKVKNITRKENWLINVYVVTDPTNPENEGKVKVVRYGKELAKVINSAIDGDDADEFGAKIFDLMSGCSLRIKCESRTGTTGGKAFVTYASSKFLAAAPLEGVDSTKADQILSALHDLRKLTPLKTTAELQRLLDQHYHCIADIENIEPEDEAHDSSNTGGSNSPSGSAETSKMKTLKKVLEGITDTGATDTTPSDSADMSGDKLKELLESL